MFKNVASQKVIVFAFDATTNTAKTGDTANISAYISKDFGAVTQLTDTSATEMDATNAPGYYLFDITQTETNADCILVSGKSSTANIKIIGAPATIFTLPANFTTASIDSNGRVDVIKIAGTTQTARDIGTSVLLSSGTGTGQLNITSGVVQADAAKINGVATTSVTTINANQGTTQPLNFTGTAASALVKSDMVDIAGAAVSTSSAQIGVNAVNAGGTAWGSGAITAASIAAAALNGKGDWNIGKTGYALSAAGVQAIWDALTSALTTVGSIGKLIVTNLDAAITSRMATYTQPTGFLAATFPGTIASTTNITAGTITTVTNLTNAPTAGDFTATMKTSLNAATPAVTVSDKTGFSLTSAYDPAKTAAQSGDAMTLTAAYDFAKGTAAMTESYASQGGAMSPVQALYQINQHLGESGIAGTTKTVKKRDGSTTAKTFTLDDATTPTRITEAT